MALKDKVYRVIIAGSRDFDNYDRLKTICDHLLGHGKGATPVSLPVEIISGTARGADRLGERYAAERGYKLIRMAADWDRYGKSAGYRRNRAMGELADMAIVFWDGQSKGTKHMIDIMKELRKYCSVNPI